MANDLSAVIPRLLAQGLMALRENAVTPRLVNSTYSTLAGERGSTIDVPIPSAIGAVDVAPANIAPDPGDLTPTFVPIQLNNWKEAPFQLSDKDELEVMEGTIPMQASEAIKSLVNAVDNSILSLGTKFFGFHGADDTEVWAPLTGGTAVADSAGTKDTTQIRKVLNNQLAPLNDRWLIVNPDAEANALSVRAYHDMSFHGDARAILNGDIDRRFGFGHVMNQNIMTHTTGSYNGNATANAASAGAKVVTLGGTGAGTLEEGDIITFAGHSQTYVVTAQQGDMSTGTLNFEPGLVVALSGGEAISFASGMAASTEHVTNLAWHRDAIGFATRPLPRHGSALGVVSASAVDPISGLTLRLEVKHEHKRLRYSYDILWGVEVIRRELGARLISA